MNSSSGGSDIRITAPNSARGWRGTFRSLENRNYRWFWLSLVASFTAMQMQVIARGWLVYDLTESPLALGWVSFAWGIPVFLLSPFGGTITDRVEKRNLLIITQIIAGVLNLIIAALISLNSIEVWHLLVAASLTGIIMAFNMPGRQSAVPDLVDHEHLMNAIALNSGAMNLTRTSAPALGGVLISIVGVDLVYYLTVILFLIAATFLFMIPKLRATIPTVQSTMRNEIFAGFSYVRNSPVLLALLTLAFVPIIFGMPYHMLMPAFATDVLGVGASGLGILMAASGIGALAGSIITASMGNFKHKGVLLLSTSAMFGIFLILFAASDQIYPSLLMLVGVGVASTIYSAVNNTLLLLNVDDSMRGRVMGIYMINVGLIPLGILPISAIGEAAGVQWSIGIGGAIVVLFTMVMGVSRPLLRKL